MKCTKAHGLGNDYIFVDAARPGISLEPGAIAGACHRRTGLGADGIIVLGRRADGDVDMQMFNADGSLGLLCGNGLRAAALVAERWGWRGGPRQVFHTGAGPRLTEIISMDATRREAEVRVDMGVPRVSGDALGLSGPPVIEGPAAGLAWHSVSMGNPHLVTFLPSHPEEHPWRQWGPCASATASVRGGVNAGFAFVAAPDLMHLRVWERGSGPTLACGSGACAAFAVARSLGTVAQRCRIQVEGGTLILEEGPEGRLQMTGPAAVSFEGELSLG